MAQRRMFSQKVIDTDRFMELPLSAQALYFHIGTRADDDGFVGNVRRLQRLVGARDGDLTALLDRGFLLLFESGAVALTHWRVNNYIRSDRYLPTMYRKEREQVYVDERGVYSLDPEAGPSLSQLRQCPEQTGEQPVDQMSYQRETEDRLGQDRVGQESTGEESGGQENEKNSAADDEAAGAAAERDVEAYLRDRMQEPEAVLGYSPEVMKTVRELTRALFKRFAGRKPTRADTDKVFFHLVQHVRDPDTGQAGLTLPAERRELLCYAFEQAANVGKAGDWNYIGAIMGRLREREIRDLSAAEKFDWERKHAHDH